MTCAIMRSSRFKMRKITFGTVSSNWIFHFSIFPFANSLGHQIEVKYEGMRTLPMCQETMARH